VRPGGEMRIDEAKAVQVLEMLMEGVSIRSTVRITHVAKGTVLNLLELIGERALRYWGQCMTNLPVENLQADEVWDFVGCKEKTRQSKHYGEEYGDAYCYTAIDRSSKLLTAWHLGKRSPTDTVAFSEKLRRAVPNKCQLTTDGYGPYSIAIPDAFHGQVDFAQLIKIYGKQSDGPNTRYSPAAIIDIHSKVICGNPFPPDVCTSHVERQNLNIRMGIRRMTRLTNAFSKKWENHEYALAIYFLYYNFCRPHMTLSKGKGPTTPAMAAGLTDCPWSMERLLDELATHY